MDTYMYSESNDKQNELLNPNKLLCKTATVVEQSIQMTDGEESAIKETVKTDYESEGNVISEVCIFRNEFAGGSVADQFPECDPINLASEDECTTRFDEVWDFDEESTDSSASGKREGKLCLYSYDVEDYEKQLKKSHELLEQYESDLQDIITVRLISYNRLNSSQESLQEVRSNDYINYSSLEQHCKTDKMIEMTISKENNALVEGTVVQLLNDIIKIVEQQDPVVIYENDRTLYLSNGNESEQFSIDKVSDGFSELFIPNKMLGKDEITRSETQSGEITNKLSMDSTPGENSEVSGTEILDNASNYDLKQENFILESDDKKSTQNNEDLSLISVLDNSESNSDNNFHIQPILSENYIEKVNRKNCINNRMVSLTDMTGSDPVSITEVDRQLNIEGDFQDWGIIPSPLKSPEYAEENKKLYINIINELDPFHSPQRIVTDDPYNVDNKDQPGSEKMVKEIDSQVIKSEEREGQNKNISLVEINSLEEISDFIENLTDECLERVVGSDIDETELECKETPSTNSINEVKPCIESIELNMMPVEFGSTEDFKLKSTLNKCDTLTVITDQDICNDITPLGYSDAENNIEHGSFVYESLESGEEGDEELTISEVNETNDYHDDFTDSENLTGNEITETECIVSDEMIESDVLISDEDGIYKIDDIFEDISSSEDSCSVPFTSYEKDEPLISCTDFEGEYIARYAVSLKQIMEMELPDEKTNNYDDDFSVDELFSLVNDDVERSETCSLINNFDEDENVSNDDNSSLQMTPSEEVWVQIDEESVDQQALLLCNKTSVLRIPSEDTSSFEFIAQYNSNETMKSKNEVKINSEDCANENTKSTDDCFPKKKIYFGNLEIGNATITIEDDDTKPSDASGIDTDIFPNPSLCEEVNLVPLNFDSKRAIKLTDSELSEKGSVHKNVVESTETTVSGPHHSISRERITIPKRFDSNIYLNEKKAIKSFPQLALDINRDIDDKINEEITDTSDQSTRLEVKLLIQEMTDKIELKNNDDQTIPEIVENNTVDLDQIINSLTYEILMENRNIDDLSNPNNFSNTPTENFIFDSNEYSAGFTFDETEMSSLDSCQKTSEENFLNDLSPESRNVTTNYRFIYNEDNDVYPNDVASECSEETLKWFPNDVCAEISGRNSQQNKEENIFEIADSHNNNLNSSDNIPKKSLENIPVHYNESEIQTEPFNDEHSFWYTYNLDTDVSSESAALDCLHRLDNVTSTSDKEENRKDNESDKNNGDENKSELQNSIIVKRQRSSMHLTNLLKGIEDNEETFDACSDSEYEFDIIKSEKLQTISEESALSYVEKSELEEIYIRAIGCVMNKINTISRTQENPEDVNSLSLNNEQSPDTSSEDVGYLERSSEDKGNLSNALIPYFNNINSYDNVLCIKPIDPKLVMKNKGFSESKDSMGEEDSQTFFIEKKKFLETSQIYADEKEQNLSNDGIESSSTADYRTYEVFENTKGTTVDIHKDNNLVQNDYEPNDLSTNFLNVIRDSCEESVNHSCQEKENEIYETENLTNDEFVPLSQCDEGESSFRQEITEDNHADVQSEVEEFLSCESFVEVAEESETGKSQNILANLGSGNFKEEINLKKLINFDQDYEIKSSCSSNDNLTVWYSAESIDLKLSPDSEGVCEPRTSTWNYASTSSSPTNSAKKKLKRISSLRRIAQLAVWKSKHKDKYPKNSQLEKLSEESAPKRTSSGSAATNSSHKEIKNPRQIASESSLSTAKKSNRSRKRGMGLDMSSSVQLVAFENLMMHRHRNMDEGMAQTDNVEFSFDTWRLEAVTHAIYLAAFVMVFAVFDTAVSLYYSFKRN